MKFERLKELKEICEKQYNREACCFSSLKEGSCDQVYFIAKYPTKIILTK
ncbi:hypothetical protein H206_03417 [Candidatus Electrothrix aarhusensis]|uniref:Uncharacterized protein n=1 Tax=Candidatus Electrothrix aarhusensis TaxID=1859131 RepID=A0A444IPW7_9BACT|nr:hypothetical protein H206_03417 [Candidatus Electrothrix aarhusensis]